MKPPGDRLDYNLVQVRVKKKETLVIEGQKKHKKNTLLLKWQIIIQLLFCTENLGGKDLVLAITLLTKKLVKKSIREKGC